MGYFMSDEEIRWATPLEARDLDEKNPNRATLAAMPEVLYNPLVMPLLLVENIRDRALETCEISKSLKPLYEQLVDLSRKIELKLLIQEKRVLDKIKLISEHFREIPPPYFESSRNYELILEKLYNYVTVFEGERDVVKEFLSLAMEKWGSDINGPKELAQLFVAEVLYYKLEGKRERADITVRGLQAQESKVIKEGFIDDSDVSEAVAIFVKSQVGMGKLNLNTFMRFLNEPIKNRKKEFFVEIMP